MHYNFREYCSRFRNDDTKLFCLRVMVGVIILYDHVHPVGAFAKTSGIDVSYRTKILILKLALSGETNIALNRWGLEKRRQAASNLDSGIDKKSILG